MPHESVSRTIHACKAVRPSLGTPCWVTRRLAMAEPSLAGKSSNEAQETSGGRPVVTHDGRLMI
ncbi:hypothetical protein M3J09_008257 [Ascochyta lentis]